jgi:hypothetical protein
MTEEKRAEEVEACLDRYEELAEAKPEPVVNSGYLSCLQRVRNPQALPGAEAFDFFLQYNAGMLLLSLKEEGINLANSVERMEARKKKGKTYFRFVRLDIPEPGTGASVHEWVETKNRNAGCPEGWPAQHYEARPLVD